MMRRAVIGWMIAVVLVGVVTPGTATSDEPSRSFAECVLGGGDIRRVDDDLSCRHIVSWTMRTYLTGTTACGEDVEYEIWDEVRSGTVTWFFASRPTVTLPEIGETWPAVSATPIPCVEGDS